jgi:hypothetical protein
MVVLKPENSFSILTSIGHIGTTHAISSGHPAIRANRASIVVTIISTCVVYLDAVHDDRTVDAEIDHAVKNSVPCKILVNPWTAVPSPVMLVRALCAIPASRRGSQKNVASGVNSKASSPKIGTVIKSVSRPIIVKLSD